MTDLSMKWAIVLILFTCLNVSTAWARNPKYIFLMIGDGMGQAHLDSVKDENELLLESFPVKTYIMTNSLKGEITDSAASATALATGHKTNNGRIAFDTNGNQLQSIAYIAKAKNRKVGILSNVPINHATPAAFYAHAMSRNDYSLIAKALFVSGLDLYIGAPFIKYPNQSSLFLRDKLQLRNIVLNKKNFFIAHQFQDSLFRKNDDISLADVTKTTIDLLYNKDGFLIVVESGKIDWFSHSHNFDAMRAEVVDFDKAIGQAHNFYLKHPNDTLIVVTADHETGGLRGITWTNSGHTANKVPLYAIGFRAEEFSFVYDNSDVGRKLVDIIKSN